MKTRSLIIVLFFLSNLTLFAQSNISFGIRAGVNLQNINGKDESGDQLENSLLPGFNVGVNLEIPVGTDIYFQPGLLFSTKGGKAENTFPIIGDVTSKLSISYIELPLNIVFKPLLGNGHMLLGFGPYVGYGIGGKNKIEGAGLSTEQDIEFKNEIDLLDIDPDVTYLKALDAGANFIIGYEMASMISLQLNAQLGLINIRPEEAGEDNDASMKNTGFGLSIGYRF